MKRRIVCTQISRENEKGVEEEGGKKKIASAQWRLSVSVAKW